MAHIRIIDQWLRSPVSAPSRMRVILVVAKSWAEQRVLMRAFASCQDQTRPTISLQGTDLAIGPAGVDPYGEWGIHVEPPVDGRAQQLRVALELAAKRMAGSKGKAPHFGNEEGNEEGDDESNFDGKATQHCYSAKGKGKRGGARTVMGREALPPYEPNLGISVSEAKQIPSTAKARAHQNKATIQTPLFWAELNGASAPGIAMAEAVTSKKIPAHQTVALYRPELSQSKSEKQATKSKLAKFGQTSLGHRGLGQKGAVQKIPNKAGASYVSLAGKTLPTGFVLSDDERKVLSELGQQIYLSAYSIGVLLGIAEPVAWMERFMARLAGYGLDLVSIGATLGGQQTYILSR